MRYLLFAFSLLLLPMSPARAEVNIGIGIGFPSIDIGIDVPYYPQLVRVPGYPVYYDPRANSNYFFYDGEYWVYQDDNWYASDWYDGPWDEVQPEYVPSFILRVPVRYYRDRPSYFRGWRRDAAPRWGSHWGGDWTSRRQGWDRWDRRAIPSAAPLPTYQRRYSGDNYPREARQRSSIRSANYDYRAHDPVTLQHSSRRDERDNGHWRDRQQHGQQVPVERDSIQLQPGPPQSRPAVPAGRDVREDQNRNSDGGRDDGGHWRTDGGNNADQRGDRGQRHSDNRNDDDGERD